MPDMMTTLTHAVALHREGRLAEAGALYRAILDAEPNQPDALHLLGLVERREGDLSRALALIGKAYSLRATLPGIEENLRGTIADALLAARREAEAGRPSDAASLFRAILQVRPDEAAARAGLRTTVGAVFDFAVAQHGAGRPIDAAALYRRVLDLHPKHETAAESLRAAIRDILLAGIAHYSAGRRDEAETHYRTALGYDPTDADALYLLGLVERDRGNIAVAAALYQAALSVVPDTPGANSALFQLGQKLFQDGHKDSALHLFQILIRHGSRDDNVVIHAMVTAVELGRAELAVELCLTLLRRGGGTSEQMTRRLQYTYYLIERAIVDPCIIDEAYPGAIRILREDRGNVMAATIVAFYLYYHGRTAVLGRLWERFFKGRSLSSIYTGPRALSVWHACRFDRAFYEELAGFDALAARLPELIPLNEPRFDERPILFFSCDDRYWTLFGQRVIDSARRLAGSPNLHVHVADPSERTIAELRAIAAAMPSFGISAEKTDLLRDRLSIADFRRTYHASIRSVRLWQLAQRYRQTICQFDIDCMFQGNPYDILAGHEGEEVILKRGVRIGPYSEYMAGIVCVKNTPAAHRFAELNARYVAHYILNVAAGWTLDQAALYCSAVHLERTGTPLRLGFFTPDEEARCAFPIGEIAGKIDFFEGLQKKAAS